MATTTNRTDKILVVDDDARIRDLLRRYLTQEGFEIMIAEDGKALNRILLRETVDLIVLDLMMPGEDGLSICRRLRSANDRTPIIMLTAKGEDVDRIVGLEVGADDYLGKPFNPRELLARIHAVRPRPPQEAPGAPSRRQRGASSCWPQSTLGKRLTEELTRRLGYGTIVARSVNGEPGLWVGFTINGDRTWLLMDRSRFTPASGRTWLIWLITAGLPVPGGAAAIARLINRPLKQLSYAANRVRDGDFDASQLDEEAVTSEIREVNIGFNRMAQKLAQLSRTAR
ncbi:Differentially expressed in FDCP 8 [Manis javanica]|nr:Differentially expressed in FDCP 8 [Manis javanica]